MLKNVGKAFRIGKEHGYVYEFSDSILENESEDCLSEISSNEDFRDSLDLKLVLAKANDVLSLLKNDTKQTLILRFFYGYTHEKISEELKISTYVVRKYLFSSEINLGAFNYFDIGALLKLTSGLIHGIDIDFSRLEELLLFLEKNLKRIKEEKRNFDLESLRRKKALRDRQRESAKKKKEREKCRLSDFKRKHREAFKGYSSKDIKLACEKEYRDRRKRINEAATLRRENERLQRIIMEDRYREERKRELERVKKFEDDFKKVFEKRSERTPEEIEKENIETNLIIRYNLRPTSFIANFPIYGTDEKKPHFLTAEKKISGEFSLVCSSELGRYLPMIDDSTKQRWLKEAIEEYELAENKG